MFSPHTRGCSRDRVGRRLQGLVFPAYAGMFRFPMIAGSLTLRFPRIRGDVPLRFPLNQRFSLFSPHTRGCSEKFSNLKLFVKVFPAYAGMFLVAPAAYSARSGFPRIRGDVPQRTAGTNRVAPFSPHTRGCSYSTPKSFHSLRVFPAYAGMFRWLTAARIPSKRFPRIRGDVPRCLWGRLNAPWFSPHTRGCSAPVGHVAAGY